MLSCIGKLFTAVVNEHLTSYLESTGTIGDEQGGFRAGCSTLDHIFVLHNIIQVYTAHKKKLYCAFIDYKKAFDMVDRCSLWSKLIAAGINGKVLTVIYNLYHNAKHAFEITTASQSISNVIWEADKVKTFLLFYLLFT